MGGARFVFPPGPRTLRLRTSSCLFQKERLLNLLEARVPQQYGKVLFLDADVLLGDAGGGGWYDSLSHLLDAHEEVHPFDLTGHLDLAFSRVSGVKCSVMHASHDASLMCSA